MSHDDLRQRRLIPTGIRGLDDILHGGVLKGNVIILEGLPGTGKTTLAFELLYRGAVDMDEPGLMLSFENLSDKLFRDAAGFGWDVRKLERERKLRILQTSPQDLVDELAGIRTQLTQDIASAGVKRLLIDGLGSLRLFCEKHPPHSLREVLHQLFDRFVTWDVTGILTTEAVSQHPIGETAADVEVYLGDTVITLRKQARRRSVQRSLEIAKSRGQDFVSGRHAFRIQDQCGVCVFPRVYARSSQCEAQPTSLDRLSSGNASLDAMLGGGLLRGSITLIGGVTGTGKTILGMQFLSEGAKAGERCLLVSLDEHPEQILRNANTLELDFAQHHENGNLIIHYDSPLEVELDEHFYAIRRCIEENGITRVVIDSVAAYENAVPEEAREFCVSLATYFKGQLITTFFNFESPEMLGISQINYHIKSSNVADNIVLLNYIEISTMIRRAITVPKARGSKPDPRTREYVIQTGGVHILDDNSVEGVERVPQLPLSSYYGVLARAPTRHSPVIDEHVAAGKPLPKSRMPKTPLKSRKADTGKGRKGR